MPSKSSNSASSSLAKINEQRRSALPKIDLDVQDKQGLFDRELRGVELTGLLRECRTARPCNIVETVFDSFSGESVDFTHCDFKDDAIRASKFIDSVFSSSTFAYNSVTSSVFERCSFENTDIQNCDFDQVRFIECDLRHLLIKSCTFSRCEFRDCKTNNQLFEVCQITDCIFGGTQLQVQTIAENFGMTKSGYQGTLRDDRVDLPHRTLEIKDLPQWLDKAENPLRKVSIDYFLQETFIDGSKYLDQAINLTSWLPIFRTTSSFAVVLTQWVNFLLWLYERNQIAMHPLVVFHSMTDRLLELLTKDARHHQAIGNIGGAHLALARVVDNYLILLDDVVGLPDRVTLFLIDGHNRKRSYERALAPFLKRANAQIKFLIPHNSPWELGLTFASVAGKLLFMALFLSTRTQFEVLKLRQKIDAKGPQASSGEHLTRAPSSRKMKSTKVLDNDSIFSLDFGGASAIRRVPNFRFRAYLPGNLVAELRLNIASKQVARLRKMIKDLL